jgi:hypothetical protein
MLRNDNNVKKHLLTGLFALYIDRRGAADQMVVDFITQYIPSAMSNLMAIVQEHNQEVKQAVADTARLFDKRKR